METVDDTINRLEREKADLLAALEEMVEHYEPMGRMGDYARAAIAAARSSEGGSRSSRTGAARSPARNGAPSGIAVATKEGT